MQPRFQQLHETKLAGRRLQMSFAANKTAELWQSFMPLRKQIAAADNNLYSVEVYNDPVFFERFDPNSIFEKWAAVKVNSFDQLIAGLETIILPQGLYAVFPYKGRASQVTRIFSMPCRSRSFSSGMVLRK